MTSDMDNFYLEESMKVFLNGDVFFENTWKDSVPRIFSWRNWISLWAISVLKCGRFYYNNNSLWNKCFKFSHYSALSACKYYGWNIPEPTWQKFEIPVPIQNPSLVDSLQQFTITFIVSSQGIFIFWSAFLNIIYNNT